MADATIGSFKALLGDAQQSDNTKRKQAEKMLQDMQQSDLLSFIQNLMCVVNAAPQGDETQAHAQVRQLAAILFKKTIHQGVFKQKAQFSDSMQFGLEEVKRG